MLWPSIYYACRGANDAKPSEIDGDFPLTPRARALPIQTVQILTQKITIQK